MHYFVIALHSKSTSSLTLSVFCFLFIYQWIIVPVLEIQVCCCNCHKSRYYWRKYIFDEHEIFDRNSKLYQITIYSYGQITNQLFCYLIIRNAEASLVEIESCDWQYKRILFFYAPTDANMNVNSVIFSRHVTPRIPTPAEIVRYFCCSYQRFMKITNQ